MPTYDYVCDACEHQFELFQSMKDRPVRKCPECGKLKARRLIGAGAGFIFKGSGFYETDYRSEQYKRDAKADREASEKASKPADSSDSKKKKKDASTKSESTSKSSSAGSSKKTKKKD